MYIFSIVESFLSFKKYCVTLTHLKLFSFDITVVVFLSVKQNDKVNSTKDFNIFHYEFGPHFATGLAT